MAKDSRSRYCAISLSTNGRTGCAAEDETRMFLHVRNDPLMRLSQRSVSW